MVEEAEFFTAEELVRLANEVEVEPLYSPEEVREYLRQQKAERRAARLSEAA